MPWPKGRRLTKEEIAARVAPRVASGSRRRRHVLIDGTQHWRCSSCHGWFPANAFYTKDNQSSGLTSECRRCHVASNIRTRDRAKARETNRGYMARARQRDPDKFRTREREATRRRQPSERATARKLLNAAVKRGEVVRPEACGRCQTPGQRLHGHHIDYSRPLIVEWLCPRCHGVEHRKFK